MNSIQPAQLFVLHVNLEYGNSMLPTKRSSVQTAFLHFGHLMPCPPYHDVTTSKDMD